MRKLAAASSIAGVAGFAAGALVMASPPPVVVMANEHRFEFDQPISVQSTADNGLPPVEYWGTETFTLLALVEDPKAWCGPNAAACTRWMKGSGMPLVVMPLPAEHGRFDWYAQILAHETGHVHGWPANHPR